MSRGVWAFVLGSLCMAPAVAQPEEVVSLLRNGEFSQGLAYWSASDPANWSVENGAARSARVRDPDPESRYVSESNLSQCVNVGAWTRYRLAGRFRYLAPDQRSFSALDVTWFFDSDCEGAGQYGDWIYPDPVEGWQELRKEEISPALGARSARIGLVLRGGESATNVGLWDDIVFAATSSGGSGGNTMTLQALPAGGNIVKNGSFDRDLADWKSSEIARWSSTEGAKQPGSAGTVMRSSGAGMGGAALSQCVEVGSNPSYSFAASFKRDPQSTQKGGARLRLTWYEGSGCRGGAKIGQSADPVPDTTEWQRLVVNLSDRPPSASSALIELIQSVEGRGDFAAFWDDVSLAPR